MSECPEIVPIGQLLARRGLKNLEGTRAAIAKG